MPNTKCAAKLSRDIPLWGNSLTTAPHRPRLSNGWAWWPRIPWKSGTTGRRWSFSAGAKKVAAWTLLASFLILFNPQGLYTDYGTGEGKYPDRVDSFSEFIVRNTVTFNAAEGDGYSLLPILTEGYFNEEAVDYTYSGDNVVQYTSSLALQTVPMSVVAIALRLDSDSDFKAYFSALRVIQGVVFSLLLMIFAYCFTRFHSLRGGWIAPLAVGTSAGFVLFAQNLYYLAPVMIAPAVLIAIQTHRRGKWSPSWVFLLSLMNFLRGYEFLSVAALLTTFAAMVFITGEWRVRLLAGLKAFGLSVLAFATAFAIQIGVIAFSSTSHFSLSQALELVLDRAKTRNFSTDGVPSPLGNEFFATVMWEWLQPGFKLVEGVPPLSKFAVLLLLLLICAFRAGRMTKLEVTVTSFGVLGYASWYVVGYQHIMIHRMYDWYIFALTVGIAATMLTIIYFDRAVRYWERRSGLFVPPVRPRTSEPPLQGAR